MNDTRGLFIEMPEFSEEHWNQARILGVANFELSPEVRALILYNQIVVGGIRERFDKLEKEGKLPKLVLWGMLLISGNSEKQAEDSRRYNKHAREHDKRRKRIMAELYPEFYRKCFSEYVRICEEREIPEESRVKPKKKYMN